RCPLSGVKRTRINRLARSAYDPKRNSITLEIIHLRATAFHSRENDYVRTIFIRYPAQHHRSRTRRAGSVALRAAGWRDQRAGGQRWGANAARRDVGPQRRPGRPSGLANAHVPAAAYTPLGPA